MNVTHLRTLALTGATGFVGSALSQRLRSSGWNVRALCRSEPPTDARGIGRVEWVRGSLEDLDSLRTLVEGAAAVVHCAGAIRGTTAAHFDRTNVDGTARLVRAAREQHPRCGFCWCRRWRRARRTSRTMPAANGSAKTPCARAPAP